MHLKGSSKGVSIWICTEPYSSIRHWYSPEFLQRGTELSIRTTIWPATTAI